MTASRVGSARRRFDTPFGPIEATASPKGLCRVRFLTPKDLVAGAGAATATETSATPASPKAAAHLQRFADALPAFLDARPAAFRGLRLDLPSLTTFRREVYKQLRKVPPGETVSYGELAERAGRPGAARAVGSAMSQNPVALVQPCHRVLGAGGRLGGFSPSVTIKRKLLELEGAFALEGPRT